MSNYGDNEQSSCGLTDCDNVVNDHRSLKKRYDEEVLARLGDIGGWHAHTEVGV